MGKVLPNEPVAKKIGWKQYFERETEPKFTLLKKSRVLEDSTNTNEKIMAYLYKKKSQLLMLTQNMSLQMVLKFHRFCIH